MSDYMPNEPSKAKQWPIRVSYKLFTNGKEFTGNWVFETAYALMDEILRCCKVPENRIELEIKFDEGKFEHIPFQLMLEHEKYVAQVIRQGNTCIVTARPMHVRRNEKERRTT